MRFDLTVNEFTRDLWADRELEVFGEQFWRPYVHVRDAARGIAAVLEAPREQVAGEVFNIGDTRENYRKLDLVEEIRKQTDKGNVSYVQRTEDPRDYKVAFEKVHATLGYEVTRTVPEGIAELLRALDEGLLPGRVRAAVPQHPVTRALVTGGAGFIGAPPRRRAARPRRRGRRGRPPQPRPHAQPGGRDRARRRDPQGRGHGRGGDARGVPGGPAGGRLPPRRADRRAPLRRGSRRPTRT